MAPPLRLIGIAALTLVVVGCTTSPPDPTVAPTPTPTPSPTVTAPAVPATAAEALAALPPAHAAAGVDPEEAERLWLRRGENTIDEGGSYRIRGRVSGSIVVDAGSATVVLVLDGLTLRSAAGPAIEARGTGPVVVVADEASENSLEVESEDAAISARGELTLQGTGSLDIDSAGDGIRAPAGVVLAEGSVRINAGGDGIRAGAYLVVEDGTLTVAADGAGLRADGEPGEGTGYVALRDPFLTVSAGTDGILAAGDLLVFSGALELRTAGGHESEIGEDADATALRAGRHLVVDDGTFRLDAAGDGGNAGVGLVVNGGDWEIAAGDDALHGDHRLAITAGEVTITTATEGIESETIAVTGGTISVVATDDAMNASEADEPLATPSITIGGGSIRLDSAAGDGLDANGNVAMTGGDLAIVGAPVDNESAIDYDGEFLISGGTLVAGGGAGMAQPPSKPSPQRSLWFDVDGRDQTVVEFVGPDGTVVGSYTGTRRFGTVVVSNPAITAGTPYTVTVDGRTVGTTTTAAADDEPRRRGSGGR